MIIAIAVALMIMAVAIFARLEEKLHDAFSDPNWMVFEDREEARKAGEERLKRLEERR